MKFLSAATSLLFFLTHNCKVSGAFCNWGPDGSGASSMCEGGAQGGEWCNASGNQCESGCGGRWCTSSGGGGGPSPPTSGGGGECAPGWKQASWTGYISYAPCCEDSPSYDPSADTTECDFYSACDYTGQFAYGGQKPFNWVQSNNIVSFFSTYNDNTSFGNKRIRVSAAGKTVEALVLTVIAKSTAAARGTRIPVDTLLIWSIGRS
jgi:hypothetical protein